MTLVLQQVQWAVVVPVPSLSGLHFPISTRRPGTQSLGLSLALTTQESAYNNQVKGGFWKQVDSEDSIFSIRGGDFFFCISSKLQRLLTGPSHNDVTSTFSESWLEFSCKFEAETSLFPSPSRKRASTDGDEISFDRDESTWPGSVRNLAVPL